MDPIHGLDWGTYYFFRSLRHAGHSALEGLMRTGNELGSYWVLGAAAVVVFFMLCWRVWPTAPLAFALLALAALGLGEGLKKVVRRPRPPDAELLLGSVANAFSFPGTAALLSSFVMLVVAVTWLKNIPRPAVRMPAYVIALAIVLFLGASQLYLGLHFVTDVLAGWTGGVLLGLIFAGFLPASAMRRTLNDKSAF